MKNSEIAKIFNQIADILEAKDENPFRIRAYRKAAQNIEGLPEDIASAAREKKLRDIPGVGKDLAGKIEEYLSTGRIKSFESLKKGVSRNKTAAEEKISLGEALNLSDEITSRLKKLPEVKRIQPAGSLRRMKETVRDIDILIASNKPRNVMDVFTRLDRVKEVTVHGPTKSSVITTGGVQVDVRVVEPSSFGSALCYFTGSKEHSIHLRKMALRKGLKINEYGVFKVKKKRKIAGKEEEEVYKALGLAYIPPEMREDTGEIELALKDKLPRLIELKDIKGDLHVHSKASDGALTLREIVSSCRGMGYEYVAITDHSKTLGIAGGLKEKELMKNVEKIRKLDKREKKMRVLAGTEVEILSDGSLDYDDSVLRELDFVIAAIHSGFARSKEVLTNRIIKAMENKFVHMIAHPTGRLMGARGPYEIDLEKVLEAARDTNTALEINAYPKRLDLDDSASRRAGKMGVAIGIATDTHTKDQFNNMRFGVSVARRGWLEKKNVLNTLGPGKLLKRIKK